MKIETPNNYYNKINFKSYYKPLVRKVNPEYLRRADYLIPIIKHANSTIEKLDKTQNPVAKNLLEFIKKEVKIFKFLPTEKTIIFNNGKSNYIVSTNNIDSITLQEQNKTTGAIEKSISSSGRKIISQSESISRVEFANDFLQNFLDYIDFALLKYRKIVSKPENIEIIKLSEIENKTNLSTNTIEEKSGVLPPELIIALNNIKKIYTKIFDNLNSIPNPGTRSHTKNSYYNIIKSPRGSRTIGFQKEGYNLFVNYTNDHLKKHLVIQKILPDNNTKNFIFNDDGKAYKQKALSCLKQYKGSVKTYTQAEIENAEFKKLIQEVQKELTNYSDFIEEKINMKNSRQERLTTSDIGKLDSDTLKICSIVKTNYEDCKRALVSIHDKKKKERAKDVLGISARAGSPSFILKNITKQNEDLQISFPVVDGIQCTKILILEGIDIIKQSFFIMEDKLVKFEAKKLGRSARIDNKLNYYSQDEINSFNINEYLKLIQEKLKNITKRISDRDF